MWSPDGTRIAFQSSRLRQPVAMRQMPSNETGTDELLLKGPGNFTMTPSGWSADTRSTRGGSHPVWRADGRELFYLEGDGTIMAVPIRGGRPFEAGLPQAVFSTNL